MDERPDDPDETPMQRALRLKKAALDARRKGPAAGKVQRGSAAMKAGASKPWLKK
ncbi:MAG: hypothetical protein KGO51_03540 [Alphaproteobacteria bacterium]|nr:hypothetical protein [Alphaproteobacteria bacterium]